MQESLSLPQCKNFNFLTVCTIDFPWFISSGCYGKNGAFSTFAYFAILQVFPDFDEGRQGSFILSYILWVSFLAERNIISVSEYCMKIYTLPFFYYYICLHLVFNYWVIWSPAFGNSLYLSVPFCTDYTIALSELAIRTKNALPSVNWRSLRMSCHRKSNLPLASSTKL